jgi:LPXTG-motif cell wall-anchored protein
MTRNLLLAAGMVGTLFVTGVTLADEYDKKTNITVNETVLIPGKTLPPGKYVMKLLNSASNRHIVQIFNEDQTKLEATILAFNNYRLELKDKTELTYWETPSGSPPAMRAWFYPGDNFGQEFAYPKKLAEELARANNNAKVPFYEGAENPDVDSLAKLEVKDAAETQVQTEPQPAPEVAQAAAPVPAPEVHEPEAAPAPEPTVIAQVRPAPAPEAPALDAQVDRTTPATTTTDELPQTGSNLPLIAMAGLGLLSVAAVSRLRRA